ncbi:MAG: ATP-binding protein [Peptostreptococcaceae bacterium]
MIIFALALLMLAISYDFFKRYKYYKSVKDTLGSLDKKTLISQVIDKPFFLDGEVFYDTIAEIAKSMNDEIGKNEKITQQYRDYIDIWIHEIKLPITSVLLTCDNNKTEETKKIKLETKKIENYVEQVLYYSRGLNLEKDFSIKEINVEELVRKIIRNHVSELREKNATINIYNLNYSVYSDSKWVEFIVWQIITNSLKYSKEKLNLSFKSVVNDKNIILEIIDDGIGIDPRDINNVFEKGFTGINGRKIDKSTGIGLYLCKMLCDKLFLGISIESEVNKYTKVSIIFPKDINLI